MSYLPYCSCVLSSLIIHTSESGVYLETAHPLEFSNVAIVSQSPLRAAVRAEVKHSQSTVSVMVCTFFLERLGELDRNLSYVDISQCHGRFVVFYECFLIIRF